MISSFLNLANKTLQSKGLQQTAMTVIGNTAATGLSAISIMITSRLLGPSLFGEFSVGFAVTIVLTKINDLGLSAAMHRFVSLAHSEEEQKRILSTTLRWRTYFSIALISASIFFSPFLMNLFKIDNQVIWFSSLTVGFVISYYDHLIAALQSLHLFSQAVVVNAIQAVTKLLGAILFFVLQSKSVSAMYLWYIAAPISSLLAGRWLLPVWLTYSSSSISATKKAALAEMAAHSSIAHISNNIIEQIVILLVQTFLTSYETGIISGIYRVVMLFSLISISLGNVLFPRVARYHSYNDLKAYYKKACLISIACIFMFFLSIPLLKYVVLLTIGSLYLEGLPVLIILLAAVFVQMATVPFIALFYAFKQNWYFSLSGTTLLLFSIGGSMLFLPVSGLAAAAWVQFATRFVLLVFTTVLSSWLLYKKRLA